MRTHRTVPFQLSVNCEQVKTHNKIMWHQTSPENWSENPKKRMKKKSEFHSIWDVEFDNHFRRSRTLTFPFDVDAKSNLSGTYTVHTHRIQELAKN